MLETVDEGDEMDEEAAEIPRRLLKKKRKFSKKKKSPKKKRLSKMEERKLGAWIFENGGKV